MPPEPPLSDMPSHELLTDMAIGERLKLPREDLLRFLDKGGELTFGEIRQAELDGKLSAQEIRDRVPGWRELERKLAEMDTPKAFGLDPEDTGLDMKEFDQSQREWSRKMRELSDSFRRPILQSGPSLSARDERTQVLAINEVRTELAGVADILRTSGEQIATMAKLAGATVAALDRVHGETAALRDDLRSGQKSADQSALTITRLTWALVGFGLVTVLLTGALAWLTFVLIQKGAHG